MVALLRSCLLVLLLAGLPGGLAAQPFIPVQDLSAGAGSYRGAVTWTNFGGDADLDALLIGNVQEQFPGTFVLRNLGGTFRAFPLAVTIPQNDAAVPIPGFEYGSIDLADVNRDGFTDLLLTGRTDFTTSATYLFRGRFDGNETPDTPNDWRGHFDTQRFTRVERGTGRWGDYDNDGDPDVLLLGATPTAVVARLYRNEGPGLTSFDWAFTEVTTALTPVADCDALWTDYDTDGDLDVLLSGSASGAGDAPARFVTRLFRNDGPGAQPDSWRFTLVTPSPGFPGQAYGALAAGDYDTDGDPDLLVTGCLNRGCTQSASTIYRNDGATAEGLHTFTDVGAALPGLYRSSAAWGDADGDGDLDVLLSGEDSAQPGQAQTAIYLQEDGAFRNAQAGLPGVTEGGAAWADHDNDGDLDVLVNGFSYEQGRFVTVLYQNAAARPSTRPEPPSGLEAVVHADRSVTLQWRPGRDAETPAGGLTYNVRVGTEPEAGSSAQSANVVSPLARLTGPLAGTRLVVAPGNAGGQTTFTLRQVQPGVTYYWSVQTIDPGYAASPFAPEQTFTLPGFTDNFRARLTVSDPNNRRQELVFGTNGNATDGVDPGIDVVASPPAAGGFDARFLTPGGPDLLADIRFTNQGTLTWILAARGFASGIVTLEWDPAQLPAGGTFRLVDPVTNRVNVDLRAQNTLGPLVPPQQLQIVYTRGEARPQTPTAVEASPAPFALRGLYPNPAAAAARLVLDLPARADVRVSVYDVLGRRVLEQPWQAVAAGAGQSVAVETRGLPAGAYLYRVDVREGGRLLHAGSGKLLVAPE